MSVIRIDIGCGEKQREGYIGVDRYPCAGARLLCDITRRLPFRDSSIDEFLLDNVIEHVADIPALIAELARTGRAGARISIITPHFTSAASWRDPTHVHHLTYFSFDHFGKSSARHYVGQGVRVIKRELSFGGGLLGLLGRALFRWSAERYEQKYCFIFRASTLHFELEVVKHER